MVAIDRVPADQLLRRDQISNCATPAVTVMTIVRAISASISDAPRALGTNHINGESVCRTPRGCANRRPVAERRKYQERLKQSRNAEWQRAVSAIRPER